MAISLSIRSERQLRHREIKAQRNSHEKARVLERKSESERKTYDVMDRVARVLDRELPLKKLARNCLSESE